MVRFKSTILFVVVMVLIGCSAQLERPEEQEPNRGEKNRGHLQCPHLDIAQAQA